MFDFISKKNPLKNLILFVNNVVNCYDNFIIRGLSNVPLGNNCFEKSETSLTFSLSSFIKHIKQIFCFFFNSQI